MSGNAAAQSSLCGMPQETSNSAASVRRSLLAKFTKSSGIAAIIAGAGAATWYLSRSDQLKDTSSRSQEDRVAHHSRSQNPQTGVQERPTRSDNKFASSIYGWAADVHTRVSGSLETVEDAAPSPSGRRNAAQIAAEHQDEVTFMRALMTQNGLTDLPGRLQDSDAELIRYAIACGLFRVDTEPERLRALQRAVTSVQASAKWFTQHRFLSREDMHPYRTLVWWEDLDTEDRPVLVVRLGRAVNEFTTKEQADTIAEVIISQIDYGVTNFLSDAQGSAEKLVVVLDCRGATAFKASKAVRLMKSVAVTLNQHYPSRLHQLFFVEPPAVMKWPIQAAKPLLHADTGNKISVCSLSDPAIPIDLTKIPDVW